MAWMFRQTDPTGSQTHARLVVVNIFLLWLILKRSLLVQPQFSSIFMIVESPRSPILLGWYSQFICWFLPPRVVLWDEPYWLRRFSIAGWDLCHLIPIKKQNSLKCININHIPFTINIYLCHINSSVFYVLTCINSCFCFWPFLISCHLPIFGAEKPMDFTKVTQMTSYLSVERSVAEVLERRLGRLGRLVKRSV